MKKLLIGARIDEDIVNYMNRICNVNDISMTQLLRIILKDWYTKERNY